MRASKPRGIRHRHGAAQPPKRRPSKHQPPTQPLLPKEHPPEFLFEPEEPSDLEEFGTPQIDDACWDVFLSEDDELYDPLPDHSDFGGSMEREAGNGE